jgi:hypothetical protein
MWGDRRSARVLDAGGALLGGRAIVDARAALEQFGAVHVRRTGIADLAAARAALEGLGFGEAERFVLGGRTSASWQTKWVEPGLRRLDFYPPDLWLLPNNEVQYQRCSPRWVLFYCHRAPTVGGRTFVHSADDVLRGLRRDGATGTALADKIVRKGLMIETGFLDRNDPRKAENYFQSWQERFQTDDPDAALARARAARDDYDQCWFREEELLGEHGVKLRTLMTRITLTALFDDERDGARYLRFPRLALDAPCAKNGYRRFPLGDGEELDPREASLLLRVYDETREGVEWTDGDLVLFDNLRYGHSRESFEGEREVYVAMAGELWDPREKRPERTQRAPSHAAERARFAPGPSGARYALSAQSTDRETRLAARTFDCRGAIDDETAATIREEFRKHGALHLRRTGLGADDAAALDERTLSLLGFGGEHTFSWGGMNSGRTTRKALSRELRATDEYPSHLWLLPHNEVLYQRTMPSRLLFYSPRACEITQGGRTFVHSARELERWLLTEGRRGRALVSRLRAVGQRIEMGFLDERHPAKRKNYFRSWQDRFETDSRSAAEQRCRASAHQFDECWWKEEASIDGEARFTLMTRVTVPGFYREPETGEEWLFFPRISLDPPAIENGHRRYPCGDGSELSDDEVTLLLHGFLATREGVHYEAGDVLIVDNVRFGHSRESFDGPRSIGVAMAGSFSTTHMLASSSAAQGGPT